MSSPSGSLRQLPARIGGLLVAPGAALARIDREGGGLRDTLWLVALGAVTFRFPQLLESLLGLTEPASGALMRVIAVLANELQQAAWVVIPAAVIVTALAGPGRDASLDLELGAACYAPYFVVRGVARTIDALAGARTLPPLASEVPAALAAFIVLVFAIQVARARRPAPGAAATATTPVAPDPAPPPARGRGATGAGLAVLALAVVGLAGNAVWSARHLEILRPMSSGQEAPGFELPRVDAPGTVALESLRGQVVVLDFWATWCPPCIAMVPVLDDLHREWSPRGVAFLGVNSDGGDISPAEVQAFLREHPAPYPVVLDDGRANSLYKIRALPQLVVIDRAGRIRRTFLGYTGREAISRALREVVAR